MLCISFYFEIRISSSKCSPCASYILYLSFANDNFIHYHLVFGQLRNTNVQMNHYLFNFSIKDFSEGDDDFYSQRHSILTEFCQSLWFALISNTDLICYLLVFINMVKSQSLLALPMPLMVFLWGTLTVPRPSKTFWVSLIAYTQVNRMFIEPMNRLSSQLIVFFPLRWSF